MSSFYMHDTSFFPKDEIEFPARLESLRVGQVLDAVARKSICLVPVATLEARGDDRPLGFDPYADESFMALAKDLNAVIAPVTWYAPTGYTHSRPEEGTFDMQLSSFAAYLENIISTLSAIGFHEVRMVIWTDPEDPERNAPLRDTCQFVKANLFNDLWKIPEFGINWWDRPDHQDLHWQRHGLEILDRPDQTDWANGNGSLPLRLDQLTPTQLRNSLDSGFPMFLASAVVENHGNQNPIGCDGYEAEDPLLLAAGDAPAVIGPAIWFGPTCYGVSGPELATTDINGHIYEQYMEGVIGGLAAMGFQDIVFVQVHQGTGGAQANSTFMAAQAWRSSLWRREGFGTGWAGGDSPVQAPTNVELITPPHAQYDHAGKNETSWMLHLRPEYTDLSLLRPDDYRFCWNEGDESELATAEWGETMCNKTVPALAEMIRERIRPA